LDNTALRLVRSTKQTLQPALSIRLKKIRGAFMRTTSCGALSTSYPFLIPIMMILIASFLVFAHSVSQAAETHAQPKLVLQITVDQLRGDTLTRFGDRFGPGGFRYLLKKGTHFTNAHYKHANTETAPGHATLATGAYPSRHGIIGNDWIDQNTGAFVYNTEDDRHHIIGHQPRPHQGVSPRNLLSSTIGDELVVHTASESRVFSVSPKDRGAILPGGHAGKAFWYSKRTGEFVTSTYYYDDYPAWVKQWNSEKLANQFKGKTWNLLNNRSTYVAQRLDDRPYEADFDALGRTFPHPLGDGSSKFFYVVVGLTPMVDELALDFAKTLMEQEHIAQGDFRDFLAISFSSPDYAGHLFGASSLEYEDAVLRLDRTLAELFSYIDTHVGLDHTLIVLSADHGGPEAPEYMAELGMDVGRHPLDWFRRDNPLKEPLKKRFGREDLIVDHSHPYIYLNLDVVERAGLSLSKVERFIADKLMKLPGIAYTMTRSDLLAGRVAEAPIQNMIRRSFHPTRSGHIHVVQKQYWMLHSTEEAEKMGVASMAAIHGSPWTYDTYVPILFAGPGISHQTVARLVGPEDIAPTLAAYLGIKPPSGSIGQPLTEVLAKMSEKN
jgi:predicted AlkP superfamily pyrophosphatase or phosphodiesterase